MMGSNYRQGKKTAVIVLCAFLAGLVVGAGIMWLIMANSESGSQGGRVSEQNYYETAGKIKGIDLTGDYWRLEFEADYDAPTDDQMEVVKSVYETRLTQAGYTDPVISINENGTVTVDVRLKGDGQEGDDTDPELGSVVEMLSDIAKLTFRDTDGNIVLDGSDIKSAECQYGKPSSAADSQWYIMINFTSEGADKFAAATAAAAAKASPDNRILIYMDETVVSAPSVRERIDSDSCVITGAFSSSEAEKLAAQINSGNLPFEMKKISQTYHP